MEQQHLKLVIEIVYFVVAILFILGLKQMSHPKTARKGIIGAGVGMAAATGITFLFPEMGNFLLILIALAVGGGLAWWSGKRVEMTNMPQMIALYNGMGGGSAAAIGAIAMLHHAEHSKALLSLAIAGGLIGSVSLSASLVAWAKLDGKMNKVWRFSGQKYLNFLVLLSAVSMGVAIAVMDAPPLALTIGFFVASLAYGAMMAVPIGGADMPVVISLFNACTGLAVAFEGFALQNNAMIIAGTVVGAAGSLLTQLMAKAMNRSLGNVLFSNFGEGGGSGEEVKGSMKEAAPQDAAISLAYAAKAIFIPGYGMAVAQAQHKLWELAQLLENNGVEVKFAIHPVAGRMPGHMNVLLAEAGVPYDKIFDLDEINADFAVTDAVLVIGANDVVNPVARTDKSSPIYGMPILNADMAKQVLIVKRGKGVGFAGIENHLFYLDNARMVYGDAQKVIVELINTIKSL
ncbi:MAG: NAD(P)(+) transhydrogenase (Re/Si-specific) subunit beta [Cystobacterineae bacterium]|nr:NAD(P)(+) transhydrogenase (Re/Si-specific) subunit beta [Cystobacterineae bacterium]